MNNVARLHVYIAQMFSQFKENMEIYQGILDGPNHMKETPERLIFKRLDNKIHTKNTEC